MHSCLRVTELLDSIFQESNVIDRVALARVCKSFSEIALDILWRDIDDLKPFLACLPVDLPAINLETGEAVRPICYTASPS